MKKPILHHRGASRPRRGALEAIGRALLLGGVLLAGGACSHLYYYQQSVRGHLRIMAAGKPIDQSLNDPAAAPKLKRQLRLIERSVAFAREELLLETADSYRDYADLRRPYVVWNVFAAPRLSLRPKQWCFPVVGCLAYKGFFSERGARRLADKLRREDHDVYVGGVAAYSTLGWFSDPVLNTMLNRSDRELVKLIVHELAHRNIYLKNDTDLNEAIAEAIALIALARWDKTELSIHRSLSDNQHDFQEQIIALILSAREELQAAYQSGQNDAAKLRDKTRILRQLQADYAELKQRYPGNNGYDRWFTEDLNNAKIASVSTYRRLVPYLLGVYQRLNGDLGAFYAFLRGLEGCEREERHRVVRKMGVGGGCP